MPRVCTEPLSLLVKDDPKAPCSPAEAESDSLIPDQHAPEAALMARGRTGFQEAITPLVPRLFRLCMALTGVPDQAEDLLQASLVKAYLGRESFAGRGSLAAWLAGIVRREHGEVMRTTARRRSLLRAAYEHVGDLLADLSGSAPPDPESWTCTRQEAGMLLACVNELAEPFRTIIWLCDIEELGYEEVAQLLDLPVGTVKSRHARGRARLRRAFEHRRV